MRADRLPAGRVLSLALLLELVACASQPVAINQVLDPVTAVTASTIRTPLVFYRDNPARAAYARDFLHLCPIEVNQSGSYRYYLWIGAWSTMQSVNLFEQRDGLESIIVFADGEPLAFELTGWTPEAIGTSERVNLKPVADATDAYYRVTLDQIRLIAEAGDIRLRTTGTSPKDFELWNDQQSARSSLRAFVENALF